MSNPAAVHWSRRDVLRNAGICLATTLTGCAPARILLGDYPTAFKNNAELNDRVLRAFVVTIVPGVSIDTPDLAQVFRDDFFPFKKYHSFFASDLCNRAGKLCRDPVFDRLPLVERTRVVQHGLQADGVTQRLYRGAIVLAQAATYGGMYSRTGDVPLIDFQGFRDQPDISEYTHADPRQFLAMSVTASGNPA